MPWLLSRAIDTASTVVTRTATQRVLVLVEVRHPRGVPSIGKRGSRPAAAIHRYACPFSHPRCPIRPEMLGRRLPGQRGSTTAGSALKERNSLASERFNVDGRTGK